MPPFVRLRLHFTLSPFCGVSAWVRGGTIEKRSAGNFVRSTLYTRRFWDRWGNRLRWAQPNYQAIYWKDLSVEGGGVSAIYEVGMRTWRVKNEVGEKNVGESLSS